MSPTLAAADIAILNFEAALATGGTPEPKQFTFRSPPEVLHALVESGVDVISLANNHGMDFGPDGLAETLAARDRAPLEVVGVGRDQDDAFAPASLEVRGTRIAVIGATQVLDGSVMARWTATDDQPGLASAKDVDRLLAEVGRAREGHDVVIVHLHWGIEGEICPSETQQELARALADAGATAVVGGHAHRVQGGGFLDAAYVHYGLGNFAFHAHSEAGSRTGVLTLTVDDGATTAAEWTPGRIEDATPVPLEGEAARAEVAAWEAQRGCTGLSAWPG